MEEDGDNKENEFTDSSQQLENDEEIFLVLSGDQPTMPKLPRCQTCGPTYQDYFYSIDQGDLFISIMKILILKNY